MNEIISAIILWCANPDEKHLPIDRDSCKKRILYCVIGGGSAKILPDKHVLEKKLAECLLK